MRVLVACEFTGIVRDAFRRKGHDAISCDLRPTELAGPHLQQDIMTVEMYGYDLIIMHPDCRYMALCGNRWYAGTKEREEAVKWTRALWIKATAACENVCLENPASIIFNRLRDGLSYGIHFHLQYIQPWQFGHPETKKTGLALHGLTPLQPTNIVHDHMMTLAKKDRHKIWYASPSNDRGKLRSVTYQGIADAMAEQWG